MNRRDSPALQRRRLRATLRQLREDAGLTQQDAAEKLDWSKSKVLRIEGGQVSVSTSDLKAALELYGVEDREKIDELVGLARLSRRHGWTDAYREAFAPEFLTYLEHEEAASLILQYETRLIPGLLQTPEYAQNVLRAYAEPGTTDDKLASRLQVRLERQRLLREQDPPELVAVLDEATLRRQVGRRTGAWHLMVRQLTRLREFGAGPEVEIRVLPFSVGEHPGMPVGSFTILEYDSPLDDDLLYLVRCP